MRQVFSVLALWQSGLGSSPPVHKVADMFRPLGSPAEAERDIAYLTFGITGIIFVVVAGLIVYAIAKFRRRPGDESHQEPPQVYGSNQIEVAWTVIPVLIVFVLIGVSARVIASVQNTSPPKAMVKVEVVGHQWWWEVRYPDYGFITANEIHIPVNHPGRPTAAFFTLSSADVNHSFWIPQLSGKMDLIANRFNHLWMDAKQAGIYYGNCAEYCGTQHANMLLRVVADEPDQWKAWTANQQRTAEPPSAQTASAAVPSSPRFQAVSTGQSRGTSGASNYNEDRATFESLACVNCHMVRGTSAVGKFGPDLTHLMSRQSIGAGVMANTHDNLRQWIDNPHVSKPGCLMPSMKLSEAELDSVVAYLETLK